MKQKHKKTYIKSTKERYRLSVYRSNTNIYAQIIDDQKGSTIVEASSLKLKGRQNCDAASKVGKILGERAIKKKIKRVVFDRGKFEYKGRIAALANAARESGLDF